MIINTITDINGTFGSAVIYNVNLNIVGTNGYKTETVSIIKINPNNSPITLTVANNLPYISGDPIYISNKITSSNNFECSVSSYNTSNGTLVINNITNINGTFDLQVKYDVTFNQYIYRNYYVSLNNQNYPLTLNVGTDLAYIAGNIIYVSDTTNPTVNNFQGKVSSYNTISGTLLINNITNIQGTYKYPTTTTETVEIDPSVSPLTLTV